MMIKLLSLACYLSLAVSVLAQDSSVATTNLLDESPETRDSPEAAVQEAKESSEGMKQFAIPADQEEGKERLLLPTKFDAAGNPLAVEESSSFSRELQGGCVARGGFRRWNPRQGRYICVIPRNRPRPNGGVIIRRGPQGKFWILKGGKKGGKKGGGKKGGFEGKGGKKGYYGGRNRGVEWFPGGGGEAWGPNGVVEWGPGGGARARGPRGGWAVRGPAGRGVGGFPGGPGFAWQSDNDAADTADTADQDDSWCTEGGGYWQDVSGTRVCIFRDNNMDTDTMTEVGDVEAANNGIVDYLGGTPPTPNDSGGARIDGPSNSGGAQIGGPPNGYGGAQIGGPPNGSGDRYYYYSDGAFPGAQNGPPFPGPQNGPPFPGAPNGAFPGRQNGPLPGPQPGFYGNSWNTPNPPNAPNAPYNYNNWNTGGQNWNTGGPNWNNGGQYWNNGVQNNWNNAWPRTAPNQGVGFMKGGMSGMGVMGAVQAEAGWVRGTAVAGAANGRIASKATKSKGAKGGPAPAKAPKEGVPKAKGPKGR